MKFFREHHLVICRELFEKKATNEHQKREEKKLRQEIHAECML
jgi:hypothetical protein